MWRRSGAFVLTLAATLSGCAANGNREAGAGNGSRAVTVLRGAQLETSTSLITLLRSRVGSAQVRDGGVCPTITLRGTKSLFGSNNPVVYVDGVRASDTCILSTLMPAELDRIEVYSMGVAPSPNFRANPNGLILVYSKVNIRH